jgi:hypothetical protein
MRNHRKAADGKYHIGSERFDKLEGSRAEVGHGSAYKTSGGLLAKDLVYIKGRWKSKKKHETAKREQRLQKHGYFAQKGKFGYVKKTPKNSRSPPRLRRARTIGGTRKKRR